MPKTHDRPLSPTLERIAKEMADEILSDPTFRAEIWALMQRAFDRTLAEVTRERPEPPA